MASGCVTHAFVSLLVSASRLFQAAEPQTASAQVLTVTGLMPSSTYNCTITSFSYSSASKPAHISITTAGRWRCDPTPDRTVTTNAASCVHSKGNEPQCSSHLSASRP